MIKKSFSFILKRRWWIAGLLLIGILTLEFFEHDTWGVNLFYDLEFILFISAIVVIGVLFELLDRANRKLNSALKILDYKHKFNIELAQEEDWRTLTARLVQFPNVITDAVESSLILSSPYDGVEEPAVHWKVSGEDHKTGIDDGPCATCVDTKAFKLHIFNGTKTTAPPSDTLNHDVYCLPITDGYTMMAILRFKLAVGKKLLPEQVNILNNVIDEMAIGLKTSYERKIQAEMRIAEANLIQRKDIWRYLHDHLGQNLAYLRLKLDQFSKPTIPISLSEIRSDLLRMRDMTDESYMMVRNWLENRHPETQSQIADLLQLYARKVAQREEFELNFSSEGTPTPLLPSIQREIYYVFREAVSNIAKHSGANKVEVMLAWGSSDLNLTIKDNGKGFDPHEIDISKHFGFGIMKDRVDELQGRLELNSSSNNGTQISIWVPVQ